MKGVLADKKRKQTDEDIWVVAAMTQETIDTQLGKLGEFDANIGFWVRALTPARAARARTHEPRARLARTQDEYDAAFAAHEVALSSKERFDTMATEIEEQLMDGESVYWTTRYANGRFMGYAASPPLVRCALEAVPEDGDVSALTLNARLYVRDPAAPPPSAAPLVVPRDVVQHWQTCDHYFRGYKGLANNISSVLRHMFRDNAQWEENERVRAEQLSRFRRDKDFTAAGLLRTIEARATAEAPQPAGLSVQLRSHQLQALKFMLDAELHGTRRFFWARLVTPGGRTLWFHHDLNVLTAEEPPDLLGGFLCEEMVRPRTPRAPPLFFTRATVAGLGQDGHRARPAAFQPGRRGGARSRRRAQRGGRRHV